MNEPGIGSAPSRQANQFRTALLLALLVGGLDLTTKWIIVTFVMDPPRIIEITSFFNLTLGFNRGVSFGMLGGLGSWGPVILSAVAAVVIGFLLVWLRRANQRGEALAIASIIGGASSNLIDRLHDGAVTDFLDLAGIQPGGYSDISRRSCASDQFIYNRNRLIQSQLAHGNCPNYRMSPSKQSSRDLSSKGAGQAS